MNLDTIRADGRPALIPVNRKSCGGSPIRSNPPDPLRVRVTAGELTEIKQRRAVWR